MSLRPRYSLLAFLLFTAAVAVGVKLWRGPHHVVDRSDPQVEEEYTYYRDWNGTKVMNGVRVRRHMHDHQLGMAFYYFYRNGERLSDVSYIITRTEKQIRVAKNDIPTPIPGLSETEDSQLRAEISEDMEKIRSSGDYFIFSQSN
jgi:hypothetical protein